MRFSPDFIDQVRESTDIIALIGEYVQLQKAGSSFRGLCPFPGHAEKTPSFFVSDSKQLYHCFGCKKSGSVFNFLMDFQGMTFPETVEYLAQRAHISLPEPDRNYSKEHAAQSQDEKTTLLKLNRYVGALFQKNLESKSVDHPVKKYITTRGLSDEVIKEFKLGYSESGWSDLTQALKRGRAPMGDAEKLGLIKRKSNNDYFDLFRDRLMFPIMASNGNVVGFGGRSLDAEQQPKYLNSPESPLFHKGRTLYGLHATAKYIRAQNEAYVVEGYMDLLALYQYGIKNVVATLGTAFTADHAKILSKLCGKVVALFDGDEAGQAAADKSLPIFLETGVFSRCLILPGERDPDEFLREFGKEEFEKLSTQAPDHFLLYLNRQLLHFRGQPTEKVEILNTLTPLLERVRDQRLRVLYLQEVSDRLGVTAQWISQQLRPQTQQVTENPGKIKNEPVASKVPTEESILVQFMLVKPQYLELINGFDVFEKFASDDARTLARLIVEKYCQNPNDFDRLGASLLSQAHGQPGVLSLLSRLIGSGEIVDKTDVAHRLDEAGERQLIQDCLNRVRERDLKIKSRSMLNAIKVDQDLSQEKLEVFLKNAKEQKGLKNP